MSDLQLALRLLLCCVAISGPAGVIVVGITTKNSKTTGVFLAILILLVVVILWLTQTLPGA